MRREVSGWIGECDTCCSMTSKCAASPTAEHLAIAIERLTPSLRPGATLVVKSGARGALALQDGHRHECAAPPAKIFDTIGAGDSFNAGYLLARSRGAELAEALRAGCEAASTIITRFPRRSIAAGDLAGLLVPRVQRRRSAHDAHGAPHALHHGRLVRHLVRDEPDRAAHADPHHDFRLSLGLAGFLPFSFFLAYGLVSIPAGALVEARGPRTTLLTAFGLNLIGCLVISLYPVYAVVIAGLFVIGLGMAMLQVVINPLMRTTGGEAHFAFFSGASLSWSLGSLPM